MIINSKFDGEVSAVLFSKILSFLLYYKGNSQLHGSAVKYQGKTICFIGESGSGKSTIASLCVMNGGKFITDEIIVFHPEDRMIKSGIPSVRIDPSLPFAKMAKNCFEEVDKIRVDVSNGLHYTETSVVDCFFFLEVNNNKELSFNRLKGSEKMLHLLSNVYGKHFIKNVFSTFYTKNISVFTHFSKEIPMFKVYRHSKTKPEDFFELIHSLMSNLDKGGETFG
nr:MAG: hypothetical protein DIU81_08755 [[Clostridium] cellulosi]